MTTRTREAEVSLLNSRIDILNGDAAGASPAKQVFRAIGVILNLIRVSAFVVRSSVNYHR